MIKPGGYRWSAGKCTVSFSCQNRDRVQIDNDTCLCATDSDSCMCACLGGGGRIEQEVSMVTSYLCPVPVPHSS
jgi:hypothetical protein